MNQNKQTIQIKPIHSNTQSSRGLRDVPKHSAAAIAVRLSASSRGYGVMLAHSRYRTLYRRVGELPATESFKRSHRSIKNYTWKVVAVAWSL